MSDAVAPGGGNPEVCIFRSTVSEDSYIGLYTAECRAEEAFALWKLSRADWTIISAQAYDLLRLLSTEDYDLFINCGLDGIQYGLDADMLENLL